MNKLKCIKYQLTLCNFKDINNNQIKIKIITLF